MTWPPCCLCIVLSQDTGCHISEEEGLLFHLISSERLQRSCYIVADLGMRTSACLCRPIMAVLYLFASMGSTFQVSPERNGSTPSSLITH